MHGGANKDFTSPQPTRTFLEQQIAHYENKLQCEIDLSELFDALNKGENVIVIDARSPESFSKAHIPRAINTPHRTMRLETTVDLKKDFVYVTYCDGIGCN